MQAKESMVIVDGSKLYDGLDSMAMDLTDFANADDATHGEVRDVTAW